MVLESKIQAKIIRFLKSKGYVVNKIINCSTNGWPDINAYKDGKTLFVEVKRPGETPDPLQVYVHSLLAKAGFKVIVADNEKVVKDYVNK